mmetsp:Transcript_64090/g.169857  ORF Transcript_64090/g.169857 Transcript_64090/m.169857 type:complete len:463 (-) Transcript_64090:51-1439(-)
MAYSVKNSLFVRNLSPQVTESIMREIFGPCDEIDQILFRAFPGSNTQFFAQIDFKSSKGVAEGSKLNSTAICGVQVLCSVIDPIAAKLMPQLQQQQAILDSPLGSIYGAAEPQGVQAEYFKKQREIAEDQRFRTVHVAGLARGTSEESLGTVCGHFGEVEALRIDEDDNGETFALVEFKEQGPAHVCKGQRQFVVDGRVLVFSDAKTMVDVTAFAEKNVHFQTPIFDAFNMRQVLATQGHLSSKLAQVRAAAKEIFKPGEDEVEEERGLKRSPSGERDRSPRPGSPERSWSEKRREKKERKKKKRLRRDEKRRRKVLLRQTREPSKSSHSEDASEADVPIEIADDEELAVIPNTELVVLGSPSSSSDAEDSVRSKSPAKTPANSPDAVECSVGSDESSDAVAVSEGSDSSLEFADGDVSSTVVVARRGVGAVIEVESQVRRCRTLRGKVLRVSARSASSLSS